MRKHHTIRTSGRVTTRSSRRPVAGVLSGAALTGALVLSLHAGYDCSGLTQASWGSVGVSLARVAAAQYDDGTHIPLAAAAPGDLVFWSGNGVPSGIYHVGMALGNGQMVDAPKPGTTVKVEAIWAGALPVATRP